MWPSSTKLMNHLDHHAAIRIGIGHGEDQMGVFQLIEGSKQFAHLVCTGVVLKGYGVEGNKQVALAQLEIKGSLQFLAAE